MLKLFQHVDSLDILWVTKVVLSVRIIIANKNVRIIPASLAERGFYYGRYLANTEPL